MKVKSFFSIMLVALVLASCKPATSPKPTLPPPTAVVSTKVPTVPTAAPTTIPATVSQVAVPSNCSDSASFVADVTVPDNTNFKQNTGFVKTWRIKNTGTCNWTTNYTLFYANGTQMNSPATTPFAVTAPGGTMDLSVNLTSPASDGSYTAKYELHDANGKPFSIDGGRYVWVTITVGTAIAAPTASNTGTGTGKSGNCTYIENATIVSQMLAPINAARAANGLPALALNAKLGASAQVHSIDMACHSSLKHTGSDGSTEQSRISAQGYVFSWADEAIYAQPPEYGGTAQAAVDWWLNDPPHRAILLNVKATEIGFGYAYVAGSALGGYFTADVAAP